MKTCNTTRVVLALIVLLLVGCEKDYSYAEPDAVLFIEDYLSYCSVLEYEQTIFTYTFDDSTELVKWVDIEEVHKLKVPEKYTVDSARVDRGLQEVAEKVLDHPERYPYMEVYATFYVRGTGGLELTFTIGPENILWGGPWEIHDIRADPITELPTREEIDSLHEARRKIDSTERP